MTKEKSEPASGLDLLRKPFEAHQISKLPKQAKWMTEARAEYQNCSVCGGYHHPKAVHLDYVGHAALTDRLLDADKNWTWEPMSIDERGLPVFDKFGGLWIKLTVCGMTRYGYGHPDGKTGGDAIKEAIGDALRNAAMRFGAALDLWHKGDLHFEEKEQPKEAFKPNMVFKTLTDKTTWKKTAKQEIENIDHYERVAEWANENIHKINGLTDQEKEGLNKMLADRRNDLMDKEAMQKDG